MRRICRALGRLGTVAPRLPVAVLDLSTGASPETLGDAIQPEAVLRRALAELDAAGEGATQGAGAERPGVPERVTHPLPSGTWVAHAALRLVGVAGPRSTGEAERFVEAAGRWHLSLADVVGRLPRWAALRVRYAAVGGTLTVGVVISADGTTEPEAGCRLAEVERHLGPLLRRGLVADGVYVLEPARPGALLVPIRAQAAVTLRSPEADELAPLFEEPTTTRGSRPAA